MSTSHPAPSNLSLAYRLSGLLAVVTFVHAAVGAFWPGVFRDPPMTAGNAQGTAVAMLLAALPVLVGSMIFAARGSLRAQLVWLGALSYILYNAAIYAFAVAFNPLFLLYVASLSLSFWAILVLLTRLDVNELRARFAENLPVRAFAVYVLAASGMFFVLWMGQIVPALFQSRRPAFLAGTDLLTSPVHVLDLGFALPISALGAAWLWQRKGWGFLLTGLMLSMLVIETASIALDQWFGYLHDPTASPAAVPVFAALTPIGLVAVIAYLRYLRPAAG
ncbi:MAG: hypothetical protein KatS3mg053_1028 [Candidatus Roseilinea sp.]|nr:MAG: hypothetical protein KatS3mg053_1028 [Candidatus Roseilinea sp.]